MNAIIVFLFAVLFVAAVWGREAAQKVFKGGMKVVAVLFTLAVIGVVLLAINLQAPGTPAIQPALTARSRSAYYVPLNDGNPADAGAPLRRPEPASAPPAYAAPTYAPPAAPMAPAAVYPPAAPGPGYAPDLGNPKIGVALAALTNQAQLGLPQGLGVLVTAVMPGGGAETAGIRPGDVLVQVDGEWITNTGTINRHNVGKRVGDIIQLRVIRGGQPYLVRVILSHR